MNQLETIKSKGNLLREPPNVKKGAKRLRSASPKRAKQLAEYSKLRKAYLTRGWCEANIKHVCTGRMVEIHHAQGRGPNLNNLNTWVGVCRPCHNWIHAHASKARQMGLLT